MGFPTTLLIPKLNNSLINLNNLTDNNLNQKQSINFYYKKQFHSNYKIDEQILKNLIHKNVLPTDPTKKVRLIIFNNKFKTSNLIIFNNASPSIELADRTNVVYLFKCPFGDCLQRK